MKALTSDFERGDKDAWPAVIHRHRKCRSPCWTRGVDNVGIRARCLGWCDTSTRNAPVRSDATSADEFLSELRTLVEERPPAWRLLAASTVLVLGEVIFGASTAWSDVTGWRHLASEAWGINDAGMHHTALVSTAAAAVDEIGASATMAANEGTPASAHTRRWFLD